MEMERRTIADAKRALIIASLLAFCFAVALPLFADAPDAPIGSVGALRPAAGGAAPARSALEQAEAMGAYEAREAQGIELRDRFNRRISRAAIERELRAETHRLAGQSADLSRVPGLRRVLEYLERPAHLARGWRPEGPAESSHAVAVPALPLKSPEVVAPPHQVGPAPPDESSLFTLSPLQLYYTPGRILITPKRE